MRSLQLLTLALWTKLKQERLHSVLMPVLALCMCSVSAMADVLFSDLGPPGSVYNAFVGWPVGGSTNPSTLGNSYSAANLFLVAGNGSLSVTQINLAVGNANNSLDTFYASIWTDNAGLPGSEVAGAYWNLSTSTSSGSCCSLVSVTSISGVNLNGGEQYFMILGPLSLADNSYNVCNLKNQGVTGLDLVSNDGGSSWITRPAQTLGAFSLETIPEPSGWSMVALILIGLLTYRRLAELVG